MMILRSEGAMWPGASARTICWCSTLSTFGESSRNTRPITMRFEPTFRSVRMRPADGPSNGSETLSRIQSLADYTIAMLESSFRKRHPPAIGTCRQLRRPFNAWLDWIVRRAQTPHELQQPEPPHRWRQAHKLLQNAQGL